MSLTIVLILKDRADFTRRWMRYMNEVRCPFPILIADGGADKEIEAHLREPGRYEHLDYQYVRYPFDESYGHYYAKMHDAARRVETPYILFMDNDDFLLMDSLAAHVRYLDEHPECVSRGGDPVLLEVLDAPPDDPRAALDGNKARFWTVATASARAASPGERLLESVTRFNAYAWYNVHRTEAFADLLGEIEACCFDRIVFMEFLLIPGLAIRGTVEQGPPSHLVRQQNTSMGTANAVTEGDNLILASMQPFWSANVNKVVTALLKRAEAAGAATEGLDQALRKGFANELYSIYWNTLQRRSLLSRLARQRNLHRTLPWRAARAGFLLAKRFWRRRDPLGVSARRNQQLFRSLPGLEQVDRFLKTHRKQAENRS